MKQNKMPDEIWAIDGDGARNWYRKKYYSNLVRYIKAPAEQECDCPKGDTYDEWVDKNGNTHSRKGTMKICQCPTQLKGKPTPKRSEGGKQDELLNEIANYMTAILDGSHEHEDAATTVLQMILNQDHIPEVRKKVKQDTLDALDKVSYENPYEYESKQWYQYILEKKDYINLIRNYITGTQDDR